MIVNKKIFLVDDDEDDQLFFTDALKEIDPAIQCSVARNGKDAIKILQGLNELPDVLFLDLNMPYMNGFECLKVLKTEIKLSLIPIVIFTTSNDPRDVQLTHRLGAEVFLSKPNDFNQLKLKLEHILKINFDFYTPEISQYSL
ncbi:MAG: response regulator [Bacteroidia bacterium]|nr:response regulator [Bacteroidota bacterium]MBP6426084.1 response regulator [Bacteroidia bacterium]